MWGGGERRKSGGRVETAESRGADASVSLFKENNGDRDLQRKTNAGAG